ncbi:MAG: vWA domain-containing protein, partial [Planctomycetota bacterium]
MDVTFDRPMILAAAAAAALLVVIVGVVGRRGFPSVGRLVAAILVRGLALLLLGAALAGPYLPYETKVPKDSVLVADRSSSISGPGKNRLGETFAALATEGPAREAAFGDAASSDPRPALLRAAVDPAERVVVATDGYTTADGTDLVTDLVAAGRTAGVRPLTAGNGSGGERPGAPRIELPGELNSETPATIAVAAPGAERVTLLVDGEEVGAADVTDGRVSFEDLELPAGHREIVAIAESAVGLRRAAATTAKVQGPLPVLVLGATENDLVARALLAEGFDVSVVPSDGGVTSFDPGDARVVVSLPGAALPDDGGPIPAWVNAGGGLLVASGAPPGLASYRGKPVSDLFPAVAQPAPPETAEPPPPEEPPETPDPGASPTEVDKEAVTLSLLIVMDRSGSMSEQRGLKIQMARAACYQTALALDPKDRLGVLAFDHRSEWIRPFAPAGDLSGLRKALIHLQPRGQTDIFLAMKTALEGIAQETSGIRHVILVSDGQDTISGFAPLIAKFRRQKITVTTVGVGTDYEPVLLGKIAEWGGGSFYDARDPGRLPRVVTMDAQRVLKVRKPPEKPSEDLTAGAPTPEPSDEKPEKPETPPVKVRATSALPLTAELDFPALEEVEPVTARFPALTALVTEEGDPALLLWRYGAGRVGLIPADPRDWGSWRDLGTFLGRLVNQLAGAEPEPENAPPLIEMRPERVVVTSALPPSLLTVEIAGEEVRVPLTRTGSNRWEGVLPEVPEGTLLTARVRRDDGGAAIATTIAPPLAESTARGVNEASIERLARAAGRPAGEIPPPPEPERRPGREPLELPLLIAALVLLPVDTA